MSEAGSAIAPKSQPAGGQQAGLPAAGPMAGAPLVPNPANRVTELRVSGHLMALDPGLDRLFHTSSAAADGSGLPGVRVSSPPGPFSRPDAVTISTFRNDGYIAGQDDAALVRVIGAPAHVLITIYQSPAHGPEAAPRLQVIRLGAQDSSGVDAPIAQSGAMAADPEAEVVAHVQRSGDLSCGMGEWIGIRESQRWIEGFSVQPADIEPDEIEYQAVLGRGWLSPWVEGGKFCGSRGMALPLLGLNVRLRGSAAERFDCRYAATFTDGSQIGPVKAGETCEAESLAPLEAFQIILTERLSDSPSRPASRPGPVKPGSRTPGARRK